MQVTQGHPRQTHQTTSLRTMHCAQCNIVMLEQKVAFFKLLAQDWNAQQSKKIIVLFVVVFTIPFTGDTFTQ